MSPRHSGISVGDRVRFVVLPAVARFLAPRVRWAPGPVQQAVMRLEGA